MGKPEALQKNLGFLQVSSWPSATMQELNQNQYASSFLTAAPTRLQHHRIIHCLRNNNVIHIHAHIQTHTSVVWGTEYHSASTSAYACIYMYIHTHTHTHVRTCLHILCMHTLAHTQSFDGIWLHGPELEISTCMILFVEDLCGPGWARRCGWGGSSPNCSCFTGRADPSVRKHRYVGSCQKEVRCVMVTSSPGLPRLLIAATDLIKSRFKSVAAIKSRGRPGD